jgi:NAD(P)-dependent dehydrogenase (short-subunit alcohol dehydrogenase family)
MGVLDDRVAVVTGAGSGVGRGLAHALAAAGATVAVVGRTPERLDGTVATVVGRGARAAAFPADVSDANAVHAMVAAVVETYGAIDILVNAAHDVREGMLLDLTDDDFRTDWWSGFGGVFHCMQACRPHLRARPGVVVNVSAATPLKPDTTTFAAYASTKEAIRALSRAAAGEWGADGIRVNVVIPLAHSEHFDQWGVDHPEAYAAILDSVPLGYLGDPETDVGDVVVWACSDDAHWVTGTTLMADGGRGYLR